MKRLTLTAALFAGMLSLMKAQVGINLEEGVHPHSTLEIEGDPEDASKQDGILIPRLTLTQLEEKDSVYGEDQDGILVYITDIDSVPSEGKISEVKERGFYYYDAKQEKWKSSFSSEEKKSKVTTIFTGQIPSGCTSAGSKCVSTGSWTASDPLDTSIISGTDGYEASPKDDIILSLATAEQNYVILPTEGVQVGKMIYISNFGNPSSSVRIVGVRDNAAWNIGSGISAAVVYTGQTIGSSGDPDQLGAWVQVSGF